MKKYCWLWLLPIVLGCQKQPVTYTILGNIEDPQNEIARTLANVLNEHLTDSVVVIRGVGSLANLDSLESGKADFGIVDNYSRYSDKVSSVMPLYPQLLHILYRKEKQPNSLRELFEMGKIFAGIEGSGTKRFVDELMNDIGVNKSACTFVDVYDLFEADVIFAFTDLLTQHELRDLEGYHLYSLDNPSTVGQGSLAEGICTRYPQFEPFIIAKELYGSFTEYPILTVKVNALLVCRADLDPALVYKVNEVLSNYNRDIKNINPLLYNVTSDFDVRKLSFAIHPGTRQYLERDQPNFFERYAELVGVVITLLVALGSAIYSLSKWQQQRKKDKIDVYYQRLINIRKKALATATSTDLFKLKAELHATQEETINLVTREKLLADESFIIFLNLSKIISDEIDKSTSSAEQLESANTSNKTQ